MGKSILSSERGNSLIMVLIAAALASMISLVVADLMNLSMKSSNVANNSTDFELLAQDINATLRTPVTCNNFLRNADGVSNVTVPAAAGPVPVAQFWQGTMKLFQVGDRVSAGTTIMDMQLIPRGLPDEPAQMITGVPGGPYAARLMALQVTLQRPADALGNRNPTKTFPVRLYFPAGGGALASCQRIPDAVSDPGVLNISSATGKIDWRRMTRFSTRPTKTKFAGSVVEDCQGVIGSGFCSVQAGQTAPQQTIVFGCSDGMAGFTVLRSRRITNPPWNDNVEEAYTTYCAIDPSKITITTPPPLPAPGTGVDPAMGDLDGESMAAFCAASPTDPACPGYTAAAAAAAATGIPVGAPVGYDPYVGNGCGL